MAVVARCVGLAGSGQREAVADRDGVLRRGTSRPRVYRHGRHERRPWGIGSRISLASREPAKASSVQASCSRERHHDVSILIGLGGRVRGVEPGSKVSMMIMRPPQLGHGNKCIGGSSLASVSRGSLCLAGTQSSWRARTRFSVRPPLANRLGRLHGHGCGGDPGVESAAGDGQAWPWASGSGREATRIGGMQPWGRVSSFAAPFAGASRG